VKEQMTSGSPLHAIIMAGGVGSRFWPFSRTHHPKQFLDILDTGKTLIQMTYERLLAFVPEDRIWVVSHKDYADLVAQQLPRLLPSQRLLEPERRNTAPCVALAAKHLEAVDPNALALIVPADHLIADTGNYAAEMQAAAGYVEQHPECLLTFGIRARRPDTGYGYIRYDAASGHSGFHPVMRFVEKPDLPTAMGYIASGEYLWNSGMFLWRNQTMLRQIALHAPGISAAFSGFVPSGDLSSIYPLCDSISIDHAIMEKADNVVVRPVDFGWSDLGTWASLYEILDKDVAGNATNGGTVELAETNDCLVFNRSNALLALQSVSNLIVVSTPDAVLVCDRSQEQKIKQLVAAIAKSRSNESL
jgi:mannose-1-phosphate guanylyltransferase